MTDDLSLVTRVARRTDGRFTLEVAAGWEQGRGAFGGLVVGAMARAAIASEPDELRTLRAVSAELVGPVQPGHAELVVETLRRGNGVTALDVRLLQRAQGGGELEVQARATFTLAKTRVTDRELPAREPPLMPPFSTTTQAPIEPPLGPTFAQHFDFRPTGPLPFSGGAEPLVEGWIRAKKASSWGPPEWLALVDCYWPALLAIESGPRPAVTLTYTAHVVTEPPEGPLYYRARTLAGHHGFVSELRELYAPDGTLVVSNPQVIAIVK